MVIYRFTVDLPVAVFFVLAVEPFFSTETTFQHPCLIWLRKADGLSLYFGWLLKLALILWRLLFCFLVFRGAKQYAGITPGSGLASSATGTKLKLESRSDSCSFSFGFGRLTGSFVRATKALQAASLLASFWVEATPLNSSPSTFTIKGRKGCT